MLIGVLFRSMFVVPGGVQRMAVRDFGMVGRFFMMPSLRVFRGLTVVPSGVFMMLSSFLVVFVNCVLVHNGLPDAQSLRHSESLMMSQ